MFSLGVLLEDPSQKDLDIIELAFNHINSDDAILLNTKLEPRWGRVPASDPFSAVRTGKSLKPEDFKIILQHNYYVMIGIYYYY